MNALPTHVMKLPHVAKQAYERHAIARDEVTFKRVSCKTMRANLTSYQSK